MTLMNYNNQNPKTEEKHRGTIKKRHSFLLNKDCKIIICLTLFLFSTSMLSQADYWLQTDWSGGPGQQMWNDNTKYLEGEGVEAQKVTGALCLYYPFWRKIGLDTIYRVGGVYDIVEIAPGVLIAATRTDSVGKIFRSSDYGDTWNEITVFSNISTCRSLLFTDNGLLFCGTYSDSGYIYRSDDSGFSWINIAKLEDATRINTLLETVDGKIFAGTGWQANVFYTEDAGTTWIKVTQPLSSDVWNLREDNSGRIYAAGAGGCLCRLTNQGQTWDTLLMGSIYIPDVLIDFNADLYTNIAMACIVKSIDDGNTWDTIFNKPIDVSEFIQTPDSNIYAAGCRFYASRGNLSVYKSSNSGEDWTMTGGLSGSGMVICIIRATNGLLYIGTGDPPINGAIFRSSYYDSGYVVSSVFDTQSSPFYGTMSWNVTLNGGTLVMKVRTSQDSMMAGATAWQDCPVVSNGQDISSLISVNDGDRYIQYYGRISTNNIYTSPILHSVLITFTPSAVKEKQKVKRKINFGIKRIIPNPFIDNTRIYFSITSWEKTKSKIAIYDVSGKIIKVFRIDEAKESGDGFIYWDGDDMVGKPVPSGIYFVSLECDGKKYVVKKIIKLR